MLAGIAVLVLAFGLLLHWHLNYTKSPRRKAFGMWIFAVSITLILLYEFWNFRGHSS